MRKLLVRFAEWILKKNLKTEGIEKANSLTKEGFVNQYFARAMSEGNIEPEPLFTFADGTECFQIKVPRATFETLITAQSEIPKQYSEFGLRKERFYQFSEMIKDQIQQAKEEIRYNVVDAQDILTRCQDVLTSLNSDFAFGDLVREHLEISLCFLTTKDGNPFVYDYEEKTKLLEKVLAEKERIVPFIFALPILKLMGISDSLQENLKLVSETEINKRAEVKLQMNSLKIIELLNSRIENQKYSWISTELAILTALSDLNIDTLLHTTI